jgi:putative endonuclease
MKNQNAAMPYYVYILTNAHDTTLYIGVTNDLERRLAEHRLKLVPGFSEKYNLNKLLYFEETSDVIAAIEREKQLKGWRRDRKAALVSTVNPQWRDLSADWQM